MSPKQIKKNPTTKRKNKEKIPRRTVKKEKPQLNMPANIKVSIPLTRKSTESMTPKGRGCSRYKKNLDYATKIELANEVARKQLVKDETPQWNFELENVIKSPKKGRSKKLISDFFQNRIIIEKNTTDGDVNSTATKKPQKNVSEEKPPPTRRIVTRKRLADSTAENAMKLLKIETNKDTEVDDVKIKFEENTSVNPTVKESPTIIQPQPIVQQCLPTAKQSKCSINQPRPRNKVPQPIIEPPQPIVDPPQPLVKEPQHTTKKPAARKKRGPKGKQEIVVAPDSSPSPLEPLLQMPKNEIEGELKDGLIESNNPGPVVSRKTSVSSNSNLSWTKDISSSSTTTCITVSSTDFVRFNKKLPVIQLTNIGPELNKCKKDLKDTSAVIVEANNASSETSDSDSSDSDNKFSEQLNDSIEVNSLHLSASSPHSSHVFQIRSKDGSLDYKKAADKLTLTMKKIDMEIINWISSENEDVNANLAKFKDKMFDILDNEFGVITHCRRLKEILNPQGAEDRFEESSIPEVVEDKNVNNDIDNNNTDVENNKEVEFVKPRPCRRQSNVSQGNFSNASGNVSGDESSEDETPTGNSKNYPYYDHHDDDDALSLFAESITGFESCKITSGASVSNPRQDEEYIPEPVKQDLASNTEKHTYCPTKIREDADVIAFKNNTICEKQNADSTSIYKQSNSTDDAESYQDINENTELDTRIGLPEIINKPRLMESFFENSPKTRTIVFGNVCFYNLMNSCRNRFFGQCRFPHIVPTNDQIKLKLMLLDERLLIQEYLLLRNWMDLRRKYGMCFVEECAKRGLTRILVEMAFDFIVKARNDCDEDTRLRVNTIETTLLHLNNVDLSICEDLLKLTIHSDQVSRTLLCDVFMATMSITQNFSRFKLVFLNLTYFMVDNDRMFNKDVVEHILERISILPFDEPVARALIQMMRLTKPEIFKNSMIGHFEKQISLYKDVFEEYSLLKNRYEFTSMLASSVKAPSSPFKEDQLLSVRPEGGDGQPPAPSPDTTNIDKNKPAEESLKPVITRTIGMNPPIIFNRPQTSSGSNRAHDTSGSSNSDDTVTQNIRKWRNRAIFPHHRPPAAWNPTPPGLACPRLPLRAHMRPPQRMPFNQRLVMFRSPGNYVNRNPGPMY